VAFIVLLIFLAVRWLRRQLSGQELLEMRSVRILNGERGPQVRGSQFMAVTRQQRAGYAAFRNPVCQRPAQPYGYADPLYAAQDNKTGLNNRLFFDNQLATLLDDPEKWGRTGW
jgi:RNase E specificity factor CsrD